MGAGAQAGLGWRRFTVSISGTNLLVVDSANMQAAPTGTATALAAAATQTLPLFTLEGGGLIMAVKCKPTLAFTGGAVTMATVAIGRASQTTCYMTHFNIFTAAADTAVRRCKQTGPTLYTAVCAWPDTSAATPAVPVACTALGLEVGDKVKQISFLGGPAAGWTEAGSTGANIPTATAAGGLRLQSFEAVITVADQIQAIASSGDLTPFTGGVTVEKGGGLESDASAGTVINALFTCTGANVSALTAGSMELMLLIADAPVASLGLG